MRLIPTGRSCTGGNNFQNKFTLSGSLTFEHIESARKQLSAELYSSDCIVIDFAGLQEIDKDGLTFLCSLLRHSRSRGRVMVLEGLSVHLIAEARAQMKHFISKLSCTQSVNCQCLWR